MQTMLRPSRAAPTPRRRRQTRGQAMVEYSVINFLLIVALIAAGSVRMVPTGSGHINVVDAFLRAYQTYYDSFYFVLNLPFP